VDPENIANLALIPIVVIFGIVAVRARRRGRLTLGFSLRDGGIAEGGIGFAISTVAILVIFGVELAAGLIHITGVHSAVGEIAVYLIYFALLNTIEESAFRGLLLPGLAVVTRHTWLATIITAVLVALPYLLGSGANGLTFLSAILAGIMYGLAYVKTGRVWMPIGMRVAWNFVQGPILGFTVSGTVIGSTSIVHLDGNTPTWLTGGQYGPEGGIIGIAVR